jgi:dolichol-phosphate mannosyltransferase
VKKIVLIPTFNEKENVSAILHAVLGLSSDYHVLIIDDNSPDGTAAIVEGLMGKFLDRLFILKRPGKQGLGTAYIQGFKWALDHNYDYIFEMDADFSHNPNDLDRLLAACEEKGADVSIGSRYVKGGETENWPIDRKIYSLGGSAYTRIITGMPIKDPTAGFICYKNKVLADINLDTIQFIGYAFQIEMKFTAIKYGFNVVEIPIIFTDRTEGTSKMSTKIFREAFLGVIQIKLYSFFRKYK